MAWPLVMAVIKGVGTALDVGGNTVGAYVDATEKKNNEKAKAEGKKNVVSDGLDEVLKFCDNAGSAICKARDDAGAAIRSAAGDNKALGTVVDGLGTVVDCTMGFGKELATDIVEGAKHASDAVGIKMGYGYDTLEDEGIGWAQEKDQKELEDMSFGERARTYGLFGTVIQSMQTADGRDAAARLVFGHGIEAEEKKQLGIKIGNDEKVRQHVIDTYANDRTKWKRSLYGAYTKGQVTDEQLALLEQMTSNPDLGFTDKVLAETAKTLDEKGTTWGAFADTMESKLTESWHSDVKEQYAQGRIDEAEANRIIDDYNQGKTDSVRLAAMAGNRKESGITWHQAMQQASAAEQSRPEAARKDTKGTSTNKPSDDFVKGLKDADQYVEDRVKRIRDDADHLRDEPVAPQEDNRFASRNELGLA